MWHRAVTIALGLLAALVALGAPARAATVRVPLDRAQPAAGAVPLHVAQFGPRDARPLVLLTGGPGQANTPGLAPSLDPLLRRLVRRRRIVAFDARGTGRSGVIRCPELQDDRRLRSTSGAEACARRLGERRSLYGLDDHVEDLEAVRARLGLERIDLYGVSYGTLVALRYAQRYPARTGRLLLDSIVGPGGTSTENLEIFRAMPRVLRTVCARLARCRGRDLAASTAAVVRRMRAAGGELTARVGRGTARIGPVGLYDLIVGGDFDDRLRRRLPATILAAERGDARPLVRLAARVRRTTFVPPASLFSAGAYAAGSCEVLQLPWDPLAAPAERLRQAAAALRARGPEAFAPFDAETVLRSDYVPLCLRWPAPRHPPLDAGGPLPPKRMLLVSGDEDLRTPVEQAQAVADAVPTARLLVVPRVAHSVLAVDESGCAVRAAADFLLLRPARVRGCR